ncbi:BRICHOS domain-containing protein 5 isoform X1 [Syngnathus scovelli]|uniref:BRICHOS domain-containing protein 5 isoform X1 n=1 Tax=Syngnathus scovelli TaxID=161590 RepID=UPI00210F62BD|nr:BRICHOS domain-containing protein 5 isoform X1 [Syngnathus scovelli]
MMRCWNLPEGRCCMESDSSSSHRIPQKAICISLFASLILILLALGLTGHLGFPQRHLQVGSFYFSTCFLTSIQKRYLPPENEQHQTVRFTAPDLTGVLLLNQSAIVDVQNGLVTFSVISGANQTSTVLFDIKHGLICYQPVHQESCFLRTMETSDYENVHSLLQASVHKQSRFQLSVNETRRQTEFLGVLSASQTDVSTLDEPLKLLCQNRTIHWTKRTEGPGKQRLVYFCIDICFPNNICVSVCFYYLPE